MVMMGTAALLVACSESGDNDDTGPSGSGAGSPSSSNVGASGSGASTSASSGAGGGTGGSVDIGDVVINEIQADGDDWIELYNPGSAEVSLDGVQVVDSGRDDPVDLTGATIAPGAYLFILADLGTEAMPGPQTTCEPGPSPCYHAVWGIGADGDTITLRGPDSATLLTQDYPDGLTVGADLAIGRLPNGEGEFAVTDPTPGTENQAPPPP
jgi:hypothetical protein